MQSISGRYIYIGTLEGFERKRLKARAIINIGYQLHYLNLVIAKDEEILQYSEMFCFKKGQV